jgi:hemerythrin superfamily protein
MVEHNIQTHLDDDLMHVPKHHQELTLKDTMDLTRQDGINMLLQDHRWLTQLYKEFRGTNDPLLKKQIMDDICKTLCSHSAIEDTIVYPLLRLVIDDGDELAMDCAEDHARVHYIMKILYNMDPGHPNFMTQSTIMMTDLKQHIAKEEEKIFPKLREKLTNNQFELLHKVIGLAKLIAPHTPITATNWLVGDAAVAFDELLFTFQIH